MNQELQKPLFVTDETFQGFIKSSKRVLIIVGTEWCPDTTRMINETLPQVMEKLKVVYSGIIGIVILEKALARQVVNPILAKQLGVSRYPTIIAFLDGKEVFRKASEGSVQTQREDLLLAIIRQVC